MGTKRCGKCQSELPLSAFSRQGDGRQHWCKQCFRRYFAARGDLHRAQSNAAQRARRQRAANHVLSVLRASACVDCGEEDPLVLEFDHVGLKGGDVAALVRQGVPLARLDAEIALCDVVCACCHRIRTNRRRGSWRILGVESAAPRHRSRLDAVRSRLLTGCADCGRKDIAALEFDHVGEKRASVMVMAWSRVGLATLEAEMDACVVRCSNCHRRRTARLGGHHRYRAEATPLPP